MQLALHRLRSALRNGREPAVQDRLAPVPAVIHADCIAIDCSGDRHGSLSLRSAKTDAPSALLRRAVTDNISTAGCGPNGVRPSKPPRQTTYTAAVPSHRSASRMFATTQPARSVRPPQGRLLSFATQHKSRAPADARAALLLSILKLFTFTADDNVRSKPETGG